MFNAIQFLKDYKIQYWTEGKNVSPGWVNVKCVFCNDDSNHLGYNLEMGYYHCWKCGGHWLSSTISRLINVDTARAEKIIFEYTTYGRAVQSINKKQPRADKIDLPGSELSKFHRQYLEKRNFSADNIITQYKVTGTGPGEKWKGHDFELRIIIPIYYNGQLVSFQSRDITDKQEFRYKGCPVEESVLNYKNILYNIDNISGPRLVVVEGILDVWRMGEGFVGSFGTSLTMSQIHLLSRFEEIFFLFDPEQEAQRQARKFARMLSSMGKYIEVINIDTGKDPADLTEDEAQYIRKELIK